MKFLKLDTEFEFTEIDSDDYESSYEALSDAVGGLICTAREYFDLPEGIDAFVNDEGLLMGLEPILKYDYRNQLNGELYYGLLVGNAVFCRVNDAGETQGLSDEDIKIIKKSIIGMPIGMHPNSGRILLYKDFTKTE